MNLKERFEDMALSHPELKAIQAKRDNSWFEISYHELREKIVSLAVWMEQKGVVKGDRVAIILDNRPEWPVVFFSIIYLGAISVPIHPESAQTEIKNILKNSESKIVFVKDDSFLLHKGIPNQLPFIQEIISIESYIFKKAIAKQTQEKPSGRDIYQDPKFKEAISRPIDSEDLATILYTSGTTDEPKGVMLTHKNLLSNNDSLYNLGLYSSSDSVISILPLHHIYPLMTTLLVPLLCGAKIIYPGSVRGDVVIEAMRQTDPTAFVAVPEIFYLFHKRIVERIKKIPFPLPLLLNPVAEILWNIRKSTGINLSRYLFFSLHRRFGKKMRFFISGGAKLDEEVEEGLFKFGFIILEGYGLTETSPVVTMSPIKRPKIGSVGLPVQTVELKIVNPAPERRGGINQNQEGVGEVIVKGPNVMKGYYKRPDLTDGAIKNGWFHTGDLGYLDEYGYLFLTGRLKETIVLSSGLNIYPEEIELHYSKIPFIKEMCVIEVPSKEKGLKMASSLYGIIVPNLEYFKRWSEINLRAVIKERIENLSKELPAHKRIMGFMITHQEFPRTVLGKIKRYAVRRMYLPMISREEIQPPLPSKFLPQDEKILESENTKKILDYLKTQTGVKRPISLDDGLEIALGIDSLGRIELASGLERLLGIKIEDKVIGGVFTVRDLVNEIDKLSPKETVITDSERIALDPEYWGRILQVLPKKENLEKIDLNPGWWAWIATYLFTGAFYILFRLFYNLRIEGRQNIPRKGPYILYVNHTTYFDGLIVCASVPNYSKLDLFYLGFRPFFDVPIIRRLIKIGRVITLDFVAHLLEAMKSCFYVLSNGKNLCLFPEGLRSPNGEVQEFKKGFGILVKESAGCKLIPVATEGAFEAWPRTSKYPKCHPIKVKFGKLLDPGDLEKEGLRMGADDSYSAICLAARKALVKLKNP